MTGSRDDSPEEALTRVLALCDHWDAMSKGESSVTAQIRAAVRGDDAQDAVLLGVVGVDAAQEVLPLAEEPKRFPWEEPLATDSPDSPVPECPKHKEVQHRDGKPPWCDYCGWNHGRSATEAQKYGFGWRGRLT